MTGDLIIKFIFWVSIFLVGYAYILYPVLLIIIDQLLPKKKYQRTDRPFKVSIVVAALNEEKVIEDKIKNCLALNYPQEYLQIVIASDGSTDRTNEIVRKHEKENLFLIEYPRRLGKINVLNNTLKVLESEIVVFSDANTLFHPDAVKNLVRHFGDPKIGCVCGGLHFVNADGSHTADLEGFYWRYESFMKNIEGKRGALLGANGGIYAIRRALFEPCLADTIIDDFMIPMKILEKGFCVIYDPQASAKEEASHKIIQEKQRRIRIGEGDFQALSRLSHMLNPVLGFPALAFWSHKVLRWLAPFFLIAAFFSNILLLDQVLYIIIFLGQCLFYLFAFFGQMLSWSGVKLKSFNLCYYFVSMNLALLLGFVRFVSRRQNAAWNRTER